MTHREIYNKAKKAAKEHYHFCFLLGNIENEKFGFEFAETDSDKIIDSVNYGIDDYDFDSYIKEMKFYKKSSDENNGKLKANGVF